MLIQVLTLHVFLTAPAGERVEFNRDIRPILSDHCFQCHGPDNKKRKADLRLDQREGAEETVVAGKPSESDLFVRLISTDDKERMPPPKSGRKLTAKQVTALRRWIEQGAEWQDHWSFMNPSRGRPPQIKQPAWSRSAIDRYIAARIEAAGLSASDETTMPTLLRRVTLDLTGVPPTVAEVDAFLADHSPNAYERVVDRLLASPKYGEHTAVNWLDAARYADTSGYQSDGTRFMWRWRDWVINALNANMPFDQFTIEQLAGDLLPQPTLDQLIATAFNRNHRGNAEGGIVPEEYAVEYVVDRIDTTATVWLGLTMNCTRCHEHKYDPISQREFYQLYAYFNNIPEHGRALKDGNSPPFIKAPTPDEAARLAELDQLIRGARARVERLQPELDTHRQQWERTIPLEAQLDWTVFDDIEVWYPLSAVDAKPGAAKGFKNMAAEGARERAHRAKVVDGEAKFAAAVAGDRAMTFDGKTYVEVGDKAGYTYFDKFSASAWVYAEAGTGTVVSRMIHAPRSSGWSLHLEDGHVQANLVKRWLDDSVRVQSRVKLKMNQWHHVMMTYDGSRVARGVRIFIDGREVDTTVNLDYINQSFVAADEPLRIGTGAARFRGRIADVRVYRRDLSPDEIAMLAVPESISTILTLPPIKRSGPQQAKLSTYHLDRHSPQKFRDAHRRLAKLRRQRRAFHESISTVMVMQEMRQPRPSRFLERGQYDKPGEVIQRGVPAALPKLHATPRTNNRLALARWLVSNDQPLTPRVTVNRYWQHFFGAGLVTTTEDFGAQGQRPSHPQLLDWLAFEFRHGGWDVKRVHREIVTSATYRQSSGLPNLKSEISKLESIDPTNRLLSRAPRLRLSAQAVRDQALSASGLMVDRLGGPSVKPYQPPGLWKDIASAGDYKADTGPGLYRRSLYTFWKRTVGPPAMMTFDASTREACAVRRTRTNTPLQALALMNDITFIETARALAERAMLAHKQPTDRLSHAFRRVLTRAPTDEELSILRAAFNHHLANYKQHPDAAKKLLAVATHAPSPALNPPELAAYAAVAGMILNLDETVMRE